MRRFLELSILICCIVASAWPGVATPRRNLLVKRAFISRISPLRSDTFNELGAGDVYATLANGKTLRLAGGRCNADCASGFGRHLDRSLPISPDGHTIAWTRGYFTRNIIDHAGGKMFVNNRLILWRDGKVRRELRMPMRFICGWNFCNGGHQLAVASQAGFGVYYLSLFNVDSGRHLLTLSHLEARDRKVPWAKQLLKFCD